MTGKTLTKEQAQKMLDELDRKGLALARNNHSWSPDQRTAFQRAARALKAALTEPANLASPAFVESLKGKYDTAHTMLTEALTLYPRLESDTDPTAATREPFDVSVISPEHRLALDADDGRARAGDSLTGVGIQTHGDPFK